MSEEEKQFEQDYRRAERRLRDTLFGDGVFQPGQVKGQEARDRIARDLRKMRESFEAVLRTTEDALAEAGSRLVDLEEELKKIAASKARGARAASKPKSAITRVTAEPKRAGSRAPASPGSAKKDERASSAKSSKRGTRKAPATSKSRRSRPGGAG